MKDLRGYKNEYIHERFKKAFDILSKYFNETYKDRCDYIFYVYKIIYEISETLEPNNNRKLGDILCKEIDESRKTNSLFHLPYLATKDGYVIKGGNSNK